MAQFRVRKPPAKSSIDDETETTGTLLDVHEGGRPKLSEAKVQENKDRLHNVSQEIGVSTST